MRHLLIKSCNDRTITFILKIDIAFVFIAEIKECFLTVL